MANPRKNAPEPVLEPEPEPVVLNEEGHPRPWRIETFEAAGSWSWRLADALGVVLHEATGFQSQDRALSDSRPTGRAEGATFVDDRPPR